jgi:hypothetical protein
MAAAEKFKTPDVSNILVNTPSAVSQPIPEESDEEVSIQYFLVNFTKLTNHMTGTAVLLLLLRHDE